MGPYEESFLPFVSIRETVLKRPGILGDLEDGQAYAVIVGNLIEAVLYWRTGANVTVDLLPDNIVRVQSRRTPTDWDGVFERPSCRPVQVVLADFAFFGLTPLMYSTVACRESRWEMRDRFGETMAEFREGICQSAAWVAPDLPPDHAIRVTATVGTDAITIAPATWQRVADRIRNMGGPFDPGYWGCVTFHDHRTGESDAIVVSSPKPRREGPWP